MSRQHDKAGYHPFDRLHDLAAELLTSPAYQRASSPPARKQAAKPAARKKASTKNAPAKKAPAKKAPVKKNPGSLATYRAKRDFAKTAEPPGGSKPGETGYAVRVPIVSAISVSIVGNASVPGGTPPSRIT